MEIGWRGLHERAIDVRLWHRHSVSMSSPKQIWRRSSTIERSFIAFVAVAALLIGVGELGSLFRDDKSTSAVGSTSATAPTGPQAERFVLPTTSYAPTTAAPLVAPTTARSTTVRPATAKPRTTAPKPRPTTKKPKPRSKPTTEPASSNTGVHPGAFCSQHGEYGTTSTGRRMRCKTTSSDDRYRWRAA
jgi:hypothetical protein